MLGGHNFGLFFHSLCRAQAVDLARWTQKEKSNQALVYSVLTIVLGCFLYGFSIGLWRSPLQGFFSGLKLPLVILATCLGNTLLNGILAMAIGSQLSFRQIMFCVLLSFALFSLVAGAFSPVAIFMSINTPEASTLGAADAHRMSMLFHTAFIAYAGVLGNWKLYQLLCHLTPSPSIAGRTLFAWLAGNLFLGAQISYILRPFFGNPDRPVQFLRPDALNGNFYEVLFQSFGSLFS